MTRFLEFFFEGGEGVALPLSRSSWLARMAVVAQPRSSTLRASPLALAHAIGLSRAPPSTLTAVAGGGGMVWGERLSWRGS